MDINKIFELFKGDSQNEVYANFEDHPLYFIKMFLKIHQKHKEIYNIITKSISNKETDKELAEYVSNIRAFHYLSKLDLSHQTTLEILKSNSSSEFIQIIDYSMKYFEGLEHYENCAFLKKVKEILI
jgi:hypothetical protein